MTNTKQLNMDGAAELVLETSNDQFANFSDKMAEQLMQLVGQIRKGDYEDFGEIGSVLSDIIEAYSSSSASKSFYYGFAAATKMMQLEGTKKVARTKRILKRQLKDSIKHGMVWDTNDVYLDMITQQHYDDCLVAYKTEWKSDEE